MRNTNLDGVRGIAALTVAIAHCELHFGGMPAWGLTVFDFPQATRDAITGRLWYSAFPADAAVAVFFVLSGYVLSQMLERANLGWRPQLAPYIVKRLFRLLPTGIVAALPLMVLVPMNLEQIIGTMMLFDHTVNGPIWSLRVEWGGFLAVFAIWAVGSRNFALAVIFVAECIAFLIPDSLRQYLIIFTLAPTFALGYLIPTVSETVWKSRPLLWLSLAFLALFDLAAGKTSLLNYAVECLAAFGFVGCAAHQSIPLLESRFAQFFGKISFPFYLCGIPAMMIAAPAVDSLIAGHLVARGPVFANAYATQSNMLFHSFVLAVPTVTIAAGLGWLIHRFIEMPGIRVGEILRKRIRQSTTASAQPDAP